MECSIFIEKMQEPSAGEAVKAESVYRALERVTDRRGQRYTAAVVLTLMLLAKLAGEKTVSGIAEGVRLRAEWVRGQLPCKAERLPCAHTYQYVCDHVAVAELNQYLGELLASEAGTGTATASETHEAAAVVQLAVDGKSLRGTQRASGAKAAEQVVGLYKVTAQAMMRQGSLASKGKERAAAFALIDGLDLQGCVVSADARHTQPRWCQTILQPNGDYLVMAKRHQSDLCQAIALLFSQPPRPFLCPEVSARTLDKQHGRLEIRHLRTSAELSDYLAPHWHGVTQVFPVERTVTRQERTTHEIAYGMTSISMTRLPPDALLALIRAHWRRDVTLGEDACRVTLGQTPQVLATLNNTVLALVDQLRLPTLAAAIRHFAAQPDTALS